MTASSPINLTVVFWGTYDTGKPRVRLLLEGARHAGIEVIECHEDVWKGVPDKSLLGPVATAYYALRCLFLYPLLVWRYMRLPEHDAVCVSYMGQFDVLVIWLATRLRQVPLVWDMFISLYDTVTGDRRLASKSSLLGKSLYAIEWLGCRAADVVFIDTPSHARYVERTFDLAESIVGSVFIGTEPELFSNPQPVHTPEMPDDRFNVLFFGQFIPLHGIETILEAAAILESRHDDERVQWVIAGRGQEEKEVEAAMRRLALESVVRKPWIPHEDLPGWIRRADLCLGIFGTTQKAGRVVPNKVYEIVAAGTPFVTADTPAMRDLLELGTCPCVHLVPAGDAGALADTVDELCREAGERKLGGCNEHVPVYGPPEVGGQLLEVIRRATARSSQRGQASSRA